MIGTALEVVKTTTADSDVGLLAGVGQRLLSFCDRFGSHFRRRTRTVEISVKHYLRGLFQAKTKNRERMEEVVPETDHQALHHRLSESAWEERAVLDQVAQEANRHLGGHPDSSLVIDESGCQKKGTPSVGVARQGCGQLGKVEKGAFPFCWFFIRALKLVAVGRGLLRWRGYGEMLASCSQWPGSSKVVLE